MVIVVESTFNRSVLSLWDLRQVHLDRRMWAADMIGVIRSSNRMMTRLSAPFRSRNGIVRFLLMLLSARQLGKKTRMDGNLR